MSFEWMLIRGSGLVAYGLLAAATIWGLVLSLGVFPRTVKKLTFAHESLSVGSLLATGTHMVALYLHDFVEFDAREVLVPGASDWRPVAVAWGGVAFYGLLLIVVSFYLRTHIGQRYWRLLHFSSLGVFLGALVHGVAAGTDTSHPVVMALYVATAAIVISLTVMRVLMIVSPGPAKRERGSGAPASSQSSSGPARSRIPLEVRASAGSADRERGVTGRPTAGDTPPRAAG